MHVTKDWDIKFCLVCEKLLNQHKYINKSSATIFGAKLLYEPGCPSLDSHSVSHSIRHFFFFCHSRRFLHFPACLYLCMLSVMANSLTVGCLSLSFFFVYCFTPMDSLSLFRIRTGRSRWTSSWSWWPNEWGIQN